MFTKKNGLLSKSFSMFLAFAMTVTFLPGPQPQVLHAADASDQEWSEVQSLLSNIKGEWNNQSYERGIVTGMPDTALLGNGDIGVTSSGGKGFKQFLISKGDFWNASPTRQIALGGITIKPEADPNVEDLGENLALNAAVTASGYYENFVPQKAVNGEWKNGYEGWTTVIGTEHWIALDLGEPQTIGRYIIKHDGAARPAETANNTKDFKLQKSDNGTDWVDVDVIAGNSASITDKSVPSFTAQYIRLYITNPTQGGSDPRARIGQIELYEKAVNHNLALNATVAANNQHENFPPSRAVNGEWKAGYEGWVTQVGKENWISLDLGKEQMISRYIIKHDGAARPNEAGNNTKDFMLQMSANGRDWVDIDTVTNNKDSITDRSINPVNTRYIRLYITDPTQGDSNPRARIGQIELYALPGSGEIEQPPAEEETYFKEEQNILNAEIDTWMNIGGVDVAMKTWTAANDNVVVTEMTSLGEESVDLEVITWAGAAGYQQNYPHNAGVGGDAVWITRETSSSGAWTSRAAMASVVLGANDIVASNAPAEDGAKMSFTLEPGQSVKIVTAVGGGGQNPVGHLEEAKDLLAKQNEEALEALYAEHLEWWKQYWLKSYIQIHDEALEKFYYGSLYFMGSSSRAGKVAPGIFGIWVNTDQPMWNNDMHLNYNFMGPFYGLYSSNRTDMALPFYDLILDYVPEAKRRSVEDLNRMNSSYISERFSNEGIPGGVLFPVGIGPFGSTTDNQYHTQVVNSLFSVSQFIAYYNYTQDLDFLENKAYSFMKDVAVFFESYLEWEEETNRYIIWTGPHEGTWAKNSSPDLGLLKYLFSNLITASRDLRLDADQREKWQHILDHLADIPTTVHNGKTVYALGEPGTVSDNRAIRPGDNTVNLEFIHPGEALGYNSDPAELQIAIDTINAMNSWGQENSFPKVFTQAARVGYPAQELINRLKQEINSKMVNNLRIYDVHHGLEKAGAIEAINNMLMQSYNDVIKLFPVWPEGKDASFTRLREKGAFVVSSELKNDKVQYVELTSEAGKQVKIVNPWSADEFKLVGTDGKLIAYKLENGVISFDTEAGSTYYLLPDAVTAADIAAGITEITAPDKGAEKLILPAVPAGFAIAIQSSSDEHVIQLDGTVIPPDEETTVELTLVVTKLSDETKDVTSAIAVIVPAKTTEGEEPGTEEPGTGEPGTGEPGTGEPGTGQPGTETGTDEPGTDQPETGSPSHTVIADSSVVDQINNASQKEVVMELPDLSKDAAQVIAEIPAEILAALAKADKPLVIQSGAVHIAIPAEVIAAAAQSAPDKWSIQISLASKQQAAKGNTVSNVYDLTIVSERDGQIRYISEFDEPVTVALPVAAGKVKDPRKVAGYRLNGASLEYVGGKYTNGTLVFKTYSFSSYAAIEQDISFADIKGHWAQDEIEVLASRTITSGKGQSSFAPQQNLTRAEFAVLIARALNLPKADYAGVFEDVTADREWAYEGIEAAYQAGIIKGKTADSFDPDAPITREELATMIMRAIQYADASLLNGLQSSEAFSDASSISAFAKDAAAAAHSLGIVNGKPGNIFEPKGLATRAESAVMLYRALNTLDLH